MTLSVDLFWSFRSPYSYLVTPKLIDLSDRYDLDIVFRPVRPLAVRDAAFFARVDPRWPAYAFRDVVRLAQMQGLPIAPPNPDPIAQDMTTLAVAADQPLIGRLTRLGQAATGHGDALRFAHAVALAIWGGIADWHLGDHLQRAAVGAGLDWTALDQRERAETRQLDAAIARNEVEQAASGHWGVPLMVFGGEPFFGQDRVEALVWRMQQQGLTLRGR